MFIGEWERRWLSYLIRRRVLESGDGDEFCGEGLAEAKHDGDNTISFIIRGVAQPGLACLTGGQKVAGSNPVAPTSRKPLKIRHFQGFFCFLKPLLTARLISLY